MVNKIEEEEKNKMNLLLITQKVDKNDDILGFVHGWIEEFSKNVEKLTIICLQGGEYNFSSNVQVFSLGKPTQGWPASDWERLFCKLKALVSFYKYIFKLRKEYDAVFVHMNKEYVLLGGLFWRVMGKKILMWYNHIFGNFSTRIAIFFSNIVLHTSPHAFTACFHKSRIMPAGINTNVFRKNKNIEKNSQSLLFVGRISPIKKVDILFKAVDILREEGKQIFVEIYGEPFSDSDENYLNEIKREFKHLIDGGFIKLCGSLPNYKTPDVYNKNEIFINLTNSGSLDKTTLEAMSCETLVLVSNKSFEDIFSNKMKGILMFEENNYYDLSEKIKNLLDISQDKKVTIASEMRQLVLKKHSLEKMIEKTIKYAFNL